MTALFMLLNILQIFDSDGIKEVPFVVPIQWRKPTNHIDDC